jgi:hypothetical protein
MSNDFGANRSAAAATARRIVDAADAPLDSTIYIAAERIHHHYLDMPGLSLTVEQAGRLCHLAPSICGAAMHLLVKAGALAVTTKGNFVRQS